MRARCRDLGRMDYASCRALQQTLFDALLTRKRPSCPAAPQHPGRRTHGAAEDPEQGGSRAVQASGADPEGSQTENWDEAGTVLLVEHPPVYTLGKSGRAENLLISRQALEALGAQFFHIDRGGDITFHGPGQLVCYPILDLERLGLGLREYIEALEEAVIRTVARYGIGAGRVAGASGVWIDSEGPAPRKICAIGVRASRYVTMHGFALNVSTDLAWFTRINPCGFTDRGVTSIRRETGRTVPMQEVKRAVIEELAAALRCRIEAPAQ
ncbi:lipoyl(octanoyl) transferase LipB [Alistipes sp.]|uniref:lipoyl(octanoyl) transferase LipB n=1 Tax=Alistipes sp. TaxID=1872444 RepID=UPI003AF08294